MTRKLVLETKQHVGDAPSDAPDATFQLYETVGTVAEIYIDGMHGVIVVGSIVKINCFTRGSKAPAKAGETEEREVACRLVMSTETFLSISEWLRRIEADLRLKISNQPAPAQS